MSVFFHRTYNHLRYSPEIVTIFKKDKKVSGQIFLSKKYDKIAQRKAITFVTIKEKKENSLSFSKSKIDSVVIYKKKNNFAFPY